MHNNRMTVRDRLVRESLIRVADRSLTGRVNDLKGLLSIARSPVSNPGLRAFLKALKRDIADDSGLARLFARVGAATNSRCRRALVGNLVYNWGVLGTRIRESLIRDDRWVPALAVISPTMRCNLVCTGCYSALYTKGGELTDEEVDRILAELRSLGCYFVVVSGGEPYVRKEMWLRLFRKYRDMYFMTYTNATLLDQATVNEIARLGNVAPAISVEGYGEETDARRGKGTYRHIENAMARLRSAGVLFGISVTYTRQNVDLVTTDEFVEHYIDRGAIFAWYFMFMPVGKDPILDMVPTPEQRFECGERISDLRSRHPIFLADFWNDGPAVGGCLAGGRSYLHILNDGRIEPCVFAHFGVDNVRKTSILEATNSRFFRGIRGEFPYNDSGNLMRPCMIVDNPDVLRTLVQRYVVPSGHKHSEDLIHDPDVVEWIDRYAERYRQIVDPVWERCIEDPDHRWYRHGPEYRDLFRFRKSKTEPPVAASAKEETISSG